MANAARIAAAHLIIFIGNSPSVASTKREAERTRPDYRCREISIQRSQGGKIQDSARIGEIMRECIDPEAPNIDPSMRINLAEVAKLWLAGRAKITVARTGIVPAQTAMRSDGRT